MKDGGSGNEADKQKPIKIYHQSQRYSSSGSIIYPQKLVFGNIYIQLLQSRMFCEEKREIFVQKWIFYAVSRFIREESLCFLSGDCSVIFLMICLLFILKFCLKNRNICRIFSNKSSFLSIVLSIC